MASFAPDECTPSIKYGIVPSSDSSHYRSMLRPLKRSSLLLSLEAVNKVIQNESIVKSIVSGQSKSSDSVARADFEQPNIALLNASHGATRNLEQSKPNQETAEKNVFRRRQIENEILSTEEKYVDALYYLGREYERPLREQTRVASISNRAFIFTAEELDTLFASTNIIRNFNVSLLDEFHETRDNKNMERFKKSSLAAVIKTRAPFMKVYTSYLQSMDDRLRVVKRQKLKEKIKSKKLNQNGRLNSDANFNNSLQAFEATKKMDLESLLIQPVQRLPRYKLLLAELLSATPIGHPEREDIEDALDLVSDAADHCNEFLAQIEDYHNAWELHEELGKPLGLQYNSSRKLLKRGTATKRNRRGKLQRIELFVFTDMIVYGDNVAGLLNVRRRIPLSEPGVVSFHRVAEPTQLVVMSKARCLEQAPHIHCPQKRQWWGRRKIPNAIPQRKQSSVLGAHSGLKSEFRISEVSWLPC